jgi:hypothetical protein
MAGTEFEHRVTAETACTVAKQASDMVTDNVGVRSPGDHRPWVWRSLPLLADRRIYEIDGAVVMRRGKGSPLTA